MIRKRGYSLRGKKVAIRGDFERKPRMFILAFIWREWNSRLLQHGGHL
ncbi:hypothetical protein L914_19975 [Phytophthora nicotianae]|uniref:Uncharacterized protein n=1 Tax=Phytophthora nicotianae TaxID=4792 RepID=W2MAN0_PHYNI|nr:hypothetical protein L914_19975 [Phytophthora nicotianae]